jgi:glutamine cyclotransferase
LKKRKQQRRRTERRREERRGLEQPPPEPRRRWPWFLALAVVGAGAVVLAIVLLSRPRSIPVSGYHVRASFPHDPDAFCQGLLCADGVLYESTGQYGHSSLRRVRLETGEVLKSVTIDPAYFAEGLALWKQHLIQLTWMEHRAFVYDAQSLERTGEFTYPGEGWGLCQDGEHLIMSDGTPELRILDPETFRELRRVRVTAGGRPVPQLNELEFIDGQVWANIWHSDFIARIDPASGNVLGWIDLTGLLRLQGPVKEEGVLNGIAWEPVTRRLFVTGKLWAKLFEIDLVPRS